MNSSALVHQILPAGYSHLNHAPSRKSFAGAFSLSSLLRPSSFILHTSSRILPPSLRRIRFPSLAQPTELLLYELLSSLSLFTLISRSSICHIRSTKDPIRILTINEKWLRILRPKTLSPMPRQQPCSIPPTATSHTAVTPIAPSKSAPSSSASTSTAPPFPQMPSLSPSLAFQW